MSTIFLSFFMKRLIKSNLPLCNFHYSIPWPYHRYACQHHQWIDGIWICIIIHSLWFCMEGEIMSTPPWPPECPTYFTILFLVFCCGHPRHHMLKHFMEGWMEHINLWYLICLQGDQKVTDSGFKSIYLSHLSPCDTPKILLLMESNLGDPLKVILIIPPISYTLNLVIPIWNSI